MTANTYGRQVIVPLTNKLAASGTVIAGDVVVIDTANNDAFTTTTSAAFTGGLGIAQESIANGAVGRVLISGYAALVNVNASVTRGNYGKTHTVAKQATDAGSSRAAGTCLFFLTGGTTPDAILWQPDLGAGSGMTNPMTHVGAMIYGGTAGAPTELVVGSSKQVLQSDGTNPSWAAWPTAAMNQLSGTVTMTSANTFYDGPSLTLAAGTYIIWAKIDIVHGAGSGGTMTAKIWDGTTVLTSTQGTYQSGGERRVWPLPAGYVVIGGSATYKVSCADNQAGAVIQAATTVNSTGIGNTASSLVALRIA